MYLPINYRKLTLSFFLIFIFLGCQNKNIIVENQKLNVLFLVADDLNCDLGSYGNSLVVSPNIDKLAEEGTLFGNAHVQYPLCGPSRASFMTGMYTDQTLITKNNVLLRTTVPDIISMGQRFRQQGYRSVRIGKIFHYDNPSAIGTSGADDIYTWDQTINPYGRDKIEEFKINTLTPRQYGGTLSWLSADGNDNEQTDGIAATEAIEQLEYFSKTGKKFFLAVGMYRPHTPFVAPKKYFKLYNRDSIHIPYDGISKEYLETIPKTAAQSIRFKKNQNLLNLRSNKKLAQEIKEAYYATTSFIDAQIGRILKKLKETGLDKNTIVVFTSDHGYHLGEHGHWQKQTLFENSTRVPLIFSGPGINRNVKINKSPVELIDIYPTLMDLTSIEPPDHVVGKSLKPIFNNKKIKIRNDALTKWKNGYSMKTEDFRITRWKINEEFEYELYDHKIDKEELINLASNLTYSEIFDSLKLKLNERISNSKIKPRGIGRQIKQKTIPKASNLTHGDIYDKNGQRIYLKKDINEI